MIIRSLKYLLLSALIFVGTQNSYAAGQAREEPMEHADFDQRIADAHRAGEAWTAAADQVVVRFIGNDCDCQKRTVKESPVPASVTKAFMVTDQGLHDDSLAARRYHITLAKSPEGFWQIHKATLSWSCWPERGHTGFSTELCH